MDKTIFICIIIQALNILCCSAQERNAKSIPSIDIGPMNGGSDKEVRIDKDSLLLMPDSIRKSNLTISGNGIGYVTLPWGNTSFKSGLFGRDYTVYGQLGNMQTFSTHQTLPILGSFTYVRFMYPLRFTDKLSVSLGFFLSKYSLGRRINDDFGLNLGINHMFMPNVSLNFEHQQSFRQDIIGSSPRISPLFPNTNTNINLQIEPVHGVKIKVGYQKE